MIFAFYEDNIEDFATGVMAFGIGLAEKVLLADTLAVVVNTGYADIASLNATTAIIISLSYTFQIFFDFSGYSNMVTGIGLMLNINMPALYYLAPSIVSNV